ncbi:DUF4412 domain-containing protein [Candidatus Woesearchaeota archaeon]|nr:DUF4412 domain-containing protein [Candidatus Woesearchaeota archaeon]
MLRKLCALLLFVFLLSGVAFAIEFSADTVVTSNGMKTEGKIYYKVDKSRMDINSPEEMIVITRIDKKVMWNIMPGEKMYMEMPLNLENKPKVEEKIEGEIERKLIGNETIDGHPTKKFLIRYKIGNKEEQVYQWLAMDINFPVKTAAIDGSWGQEYKNIKMSTQPDSLFEIPAGYNKFQIPGGRYFK